MMSGLFTSNEEERQLVLATGNPAKVTELNDLLKGSGIRVRSLTEVAGPCEIEETGRTLEENAEIKARFVFDKTGLPALADDTGLEVDALDGMPGVYSARYGGPETDSARNRKKLLTSLKHLPSAQDRKARFRTVLAYIDTHGLRRFEGICNGVILTEERGDGGFGYDPLFMPEGYDLSFAEMDPSEKNRISHRGRALQKFLQEISDR
ncbi:RdgB/HAM1 family non-canonical purine NTP pyrophosphatase [Balneolales bacterium ANBcel1]|nr:RdgB/HAM1 family non-canonical purine NTP pyrophosphatase [Balneolales bacterium ANBcel1]